MTTFTKIAALAICAGCGRIGFDGAGTGSMTADGANGADGEDVCGVPNGAIVHLRFDDGSGQQAIDASGAGNDAQLIGMDDSDWVAGRVGDALDFDGVDDHVSAGSAPSVDDVAPLTMCAWIYPRSYPSQFPAIADKSNDTFIGGWNFYIEDNTQFGFLTNQRKWITGGTITLGAWTHVCAAWDGSTGLTGIQLFQDGVMTAMKLSGSNGNQLDSDAVHDVLVGRVNNGTFPFDGLVDDFIVYPRVLTPAEVGVIYNCAGS
ncbi:MAG TPA: LamG domain-containing protein [Kofleriaceae bacterium]